MNIRKVIERRIRKRVGGVDVASDVNAVVAANVGERGQSTHVSSKQTVTTAQGGRTEEREKGDT